MGSSEAKVYSDRLLKDCIKTLKVKGKCKTAVKLSLADKQHLFALE